MVILSKLTPLTQSHNLYIGAWRATLKLNYDSKTVFVTQQHAFFVVSSYGPDYCLNHATIIGIL